VDDTRIPKSATGMMGFTVNGAFSAGVEVHATPRAVPEANMNRAVGARGLRGRIESACGHKVPLGRLRPHIVSANGAIQLQPGATAPGKP
jgi:hypothetical protein